MRRISHFVFFALILTLFSCKGEEKKQVQVQAKTTVYPKLPNDLHQKLYYEVDYLDFIFHHLPFSMSQSEKASVQTNISYIGQTGVSEIPVNCKSVAREFFQIEGEIVVEADVYFSEGCYFYVFYIDGVAKYANTMSQNGIGFFDNIIKQAIEASKGLGQ